MSGMRKMWTARATGVVLTFALALRPESAQAHGTAASAPPPRYRSELYLPVGLSLYSGAERLAVGLGGGLGYRYLVSDVTSLFGEARLGWFTGLLGTIAVGSTIGLHVRGWNPQLGVAALFFLGDGVRVLSSQEPDVPPKVAFAPAVRLSPLRFVSGRFFASALSVDLGCGLWGRRCALAVNATILEAGTRF
jgi:hypothetical protein